MPNWGAIGGTIKNGAIGAYSVLGGYVKGMSPNQRMQMYGAGVGMGVNMINNARNRDPLLRGNMKAAVIGSAIGGLGHYGVGAYGRAGGFKGMPNLIKSEATAFYGAAKNEFGTYKNTVSSYFNGFKQGRGEEMVETARARVRPGRLNSVRGPFRARGYQNTREARARNLARGFRPGSSRTLFG